jgi:hypothetical protein
MTNFQQILYSFAKEYELNLTLESIEARYFKDQDVFKNFLLEMGGEDGLMSMVETTQPSHGLIKHIVENDSDILSEESRGELMLYVLDKDPKVSSEWVFRTDIPVCVQEALCKTNLRNSDRTRFAKIIPQSLRNSDSFSEGFLYELGWAVVEKQKRIYSDKRYRSPRIALLYLEVYRSAGLHNLELLRELNRFIFLWNEKVIQKYGDWTKKEWRETAEAFGVEDLILESYEF